MGADGAVAIMAHRELQQLETTARRSSTRWRSDGPSGGASPAVPHASRATDPCDAALLGRYREPLTSASGGPRGLQAETVWRMHRSGPTGARRSRTAAERGSKLTSASWSLSCRGFYDRLQASSSSILPSAQTTTRTGERCFRSVSMGARLPASRPKRTHRLRGVARRVARSGPLRAARAAEGRAMRRLAALRGKAAALVSGCKRRPSQEEPIAVKPRGLAAETTTAWAGIVVPPVKQLRALSAAAQGERNGRLAQADGASVGKASHHS